jgi:hypothetical protein
VASRRVVGIVALCAAAAVVVIVGGTVLLSRHETTTPAGAVTTPRPGKPLLALELGLRQDAEAKALRQAQRLLDEEKKPAQAAAIFKRYASVEAKLGLAFSQWTGPRSLSSVQSIAASYADSPAAQLNLGLADYQAGRNADAVRAWQGTATRFPDSPYAVDAVSALNPNPNVAPGLPLILVDPAAVPANARPAFVAGVNHWNLKEVVSARRQLDAAARLAPNSPEALVAAAVARFSPAQPKAPFPVLGPLTATFPHDAVVRLHLGELLLWNREVAKGKAQLRLAVADEPNSRYAKEARGILEQLGQT